MGFWPKEKTIAILDISVLQNKGSYSILSMLYRCHKIKLRNSGDKPQYILDCCGNAVHIRVRRIKLSTLTKGDDIK